MKIAYCLFKPKKLQKQTTNKENQNKLLKLYSWKYMKTILPTRKAFSYGRETTTLRDATVRETKGDADADVVQIEEWTEVSELKNCACFGPGNMWSRKWTRKRWGLEMS